MCLEIMCLLMFSLFSLFSICTFLIELIIGISTLWTFLSIYLPSFTSTSEKSAENGFVIVVCATLCKLYEINLWQSLTAYPTMWYFLHQSVQANINVDCESSTTPLICRVLHAPKAQPDKYINIGTDKCGVSKQARKRQLETYLGDWKRGK